MRLFIAAPVPPADPILVLLQELRDLGAQSRTGLQVVPPANLHVTLKFLGEVPADRISAIVSAMDSALADEPCFDVQVGGRGSFPSALWLQVRASALGRMADRLDEALSVIGFQPERRAYRPHVTLARLKPHTDFDVGAWLARDEVRQPLTFSVGNVMLYRSVPVAGGIRYEPLHTLVLARPSAP